MRIAWFLLALVACGNHNNATHDATDSPGSCAMGMADHPTFWPTLCDAADTCGWLTGGHPELDTDEASCNARHASDPDPSSQLSYLAGFETRIHAAAACLGCQTLLDAYFRPDLETVFCAQVARCGGLSDTACRTQYEADAMRPGSQAKFDHACPRYCIEQLATDAPCPDVVACLSACS